MFEFTPIIVAFLTGTAGPVIVMVVRSYLEKRSKARDMVIDAVEVGNLISTKIDHIREEMRADRVWVSQFHNGGHFYPTGKSIAKFSIFYETVGTGVNSVQSNFQNIPVNLFSKSVNKLSEDDIIQIADYKDDEIATYGLKYIAQDTGCKSGYLFAIKTIDGKFIGTLGLDYTKRKTRLGDDDIQHLINHATAIGGVLMTHLNQK